MKLLLLCLALFSLPAEATIYLFATDSSTGAIGAAVITSGPITSPDRIMVARKGLGIIGWGGKVEAPPRSIDPALFSLMEAKAPASAISARILNHYGDSYYRAGFITAYGELGYALPVTGCPVEECGLRENTLGKFLLIGGGLEHGVLDASLRAFSEISESRDLSLPCKLMKGLEAIAAVGGETKEFTSAQIIVDDPSRLDLLQAVSHFEGKPEPELLKDTKLKLNALGAGCI